MDDAEAPETPPAFTIPAGGGKNGCQVRTHFNSGGTENDCGMA
jgi:hypothetical protein